MSSQVLPVLSSLRTRWTNARVTDRQLLDLRTSLRRRAGFTWGDELGGVGLATWTHPTQDHSK
jgi:hypothetical protein